MDEFSDKMIHLSFRRNHPIRNLLDLMIVEYADKNSDTQAILKPMTLTVLMYIAREFKKSKQSTDNLSSVDEILKYISEHSENVTLEKLAQNFSYHPNYICSLLRKETGKTFSQIVLEQRMNRALSLLKGTNLSVEEISSIVGYNDPSNFYRSFRSYYHKSPREYLK